MAQRSFRVGVGLLPSDVVKEDLDVVFSTYGVVVSIEVHEPDHRGFRTAEVCYSDAGSAEDAVNVLNGVYKIREDADDPIQVWWGGVDPKDSSGGGSGGRGGGAAAAGGGAGGAGAGPGAAAGGGGGGGAEPGGRGGGTGHKLFVGQLPEDISEQELKMVFSTYGEVNHVVIMKAHATSGLRGAFVFYDQRESGEDAIQVLHDQYRIREGSARPLQVKWAKEKEGGGGGGGGKDPGHRLFVGNLPRDTSEEELRIVFSTYGEVNLIHVMEPNNSGKRAALVFYNEREAAEDAIQLLNEQYKIREDAEEPITVKWGKERDSNRGRGGGNNYDDGGWRSSSQDDRRGWQEKSGHDDGGWQSRQQGYDHGWGGGGGRDERPGNNDRGDRRSRSPYREWDRDRPRGCNGCNGGSSWSGDRGGGGGGGGDYDSRDRGRGGRGDSHGYDRNADREVDRYSDRGYDRDRGGGGDRGGDRGEDPLKLHVSNLPDDIKVEALKYVFQTYGEVENVHILSGNAKNGSVAAFVEYSSQADADVAIESLSDVYEIRKGFGPIVVKHARMRGRGRP